MNTSVEAKKFPRQKKGFTIIELLVVISIIGVLSGISFVTYNGVTRRAKHAATIANTAQAAKKLALFNAENGYYPNREQFDEDFGDIFGDDYYDYEPYCNGGPCEDDEFPDGYKLLGYPDYISDACKNYDDCDDDDLGDIGMVSSDNPSGISMEAPKDCPDGFIPVPGSILYKQQGFCVMKYEASKSPSGNNIPVSAENGEPWTSISQSKAWEYSSNVKDCVGCHLIKESEWMTIAQNIFNVKENWDKNKVGSGSLYRGNVTGSISSASTPSNGQKRDLTLSNGQKIWDFSGNAAELTQGRIKCNAMPAYKGSGEWYETFINALYMQWYELSFFGDKTLELNGLEGTISVPPKLVEEKGMKTENGIGVLSGACSELNEPSDSYVFARGGMVFNNEEGDISFNFGGIYSLIITDLNEGDGNSVTTFRVTR